MASWIGAIIIGGLAGWLAEKFMKSSMGLIANILLGIVGGLVARFIASFIGMGITGTLPYLVASVAGACLLVFLARAIR
jgi:uncharacterized membrane protein YeaQ/YmgE (transglycosylase-associated protein family)